LGKQVRHMAEVAAHLIKGGELLRRGEENSGEARPLLPRGHHLRAVLLRPEEEITPVALRLLRPAIRTHEQHRLEANDEMVILDRDKALLHARLIKFKNTS